MLTRAWFVFFLFASTAYAQPRVGDELVSDPAVWRSFRPLVLATGDGDRARAVSYLRASNILLRKVEAHLERDRPTEAFYKAASESFEELDLRRLMSLLPEPEPEGAFRRFAVQGQQTPSSYRLSRPSGDFEVDAHSQRRGFGDSSSVLRMRRLESGDGKRFLLQFRSGVGLGALHWDSLQQGAVDFARGLEECAVEPAEESRPMVLRAADAYLKKTQPELGAEDRRWLALAFASFPELAQLLTTFSRTDDVIDRERSRGGITHLRMINRFEVKQLQQRYPELADYFHDLGDLFDVKIQVRDAADNTLVDVWFESGRMLSRVEAYLRDGALVPSRAGKPLPDVAPAFERMEAHVDAHAHAVGIHMYVDDLRIAMSLKPDGTLTTRVRHTPGFRVEGRALGFIPASMLDWFIPGDIPGLARRMFDIASKGNGGQGIVLDGRFARQGDLATLDVSAGVEVLDTALVRFGMSIAGERGIPDEAQSEDIRKLWVAYRDALAKDIERFARYGKLP